MSERALGRLDAIPDGGAVGFAPHGPTGRPLMAIRQGGQVFVYVNSCPHTGAPLDFQHGTFLNDDATLIHCSIHGALFRIDDGFCIAGPCAGRCLAALRSAVRDGWVFVSS